jgi:hypothetical protein
MRATTAHNRQRGDRDERHATTASHGHTARWTVTDAVRPDAGPVLLETKRGSGPSPSRTSPAWKIGRVTRRPTRQATTRAFAGPAERE